MGVIKRGVLGGFSGKVANVIGGSWKGIAYMRSQPLSVANPNTAGQVNQRSAFSDIVALAQLHLVAMIKPLMDSFTSQMSGFNYFVQQNIAEWVSPGVFMWANLRFSIGSLTPVTVSAVTGANNSKNTHITWTDNSGDGSALGDDVVYAVTYNEDNDEWGFQNGAANRNSASVACLCATNNSTGDTLHGYLSFKSLDGKRVSTTTYTTVVL